MKRFLAMIVFLLVGTLVAGCSSYTNWMNTSNLEVSVAGPAKLDQNGAIQINGTGFHAGDNIVLLFNSADGIKSDLSGSIKPEPVADANGNWTTKWSYGRMVKKKIIKEGSYTIDVVNEDYEKLASVSVTFVK